MGGRQETEVEGSLVQFRDLDGPLLAGLAEVWFQRDGVERHEAVDGPPDLAECREDPYLGAAVADDGQVGEFAAGDGPDQRHGLAA